MSRARTHLAQQVAFGVLISAQIEMDHQSRAADAAAYARKAEAAAAAAASTGIFVAPPSCCPPFLLSLCLEGPSDA